MQKKKIQKGKKQTTNTPNKQTNKWINKQKNKPGFFSGGGGGTGGSPPSRKNFANPPHLTLVPRFWTKACPPPAEVRPRKFEKFKYIFVSNLTTFKLKSTLKSCISCLKIAKKWANFALSGQFWLQSDFPTGMEKFWVPPIKNLEKKTLQTSHEMWMMGRRVKDDSHTRCFSQWNSTLNFLILTPHTPLLYSPPPKKNNNNIGRSIFFVVATTRTCS